MIIDTHAHYDDEAFDADRENLITGFKDNGIGLVVNIGAEFKGCVDTLALALKYPNVYGALGVHPSELDEMDDDKLRFIKTNCDENRADKGGKIVAVGEIGLDYHYPDTDATLQKKWFEAQLLMARDIKMPVVIHSRDAAKDTLDMMRSLHAEDIGGIVHCYSYALEQAKIYHSMGFYFGIGGIITFKNARKLIEVVDYLPLSAIVLETDSPYLAPEPNRGQRNDSRNLKYVVKKIAEIKGVSEDEVISATEKNARRVYRLPD